MKFYKSRSSIWWNKGLETKPTYKDFSEIQWEELSNFNVNWLSEISISCVVGLQDTFDLIKIENEDAEVSHEKVKYYYLTEILDKTKLNKTCIFELDIWTTYFLEPRNQSETNLQNIKMYSDILHNIEDVKTQWRNGTQSRLVSITPAGLVRSKKRKMKTLSREIPLPKTQSEANSTLKSTDFFADARMLTSADRAGSIYYVFNTSGNLGQYLLVPLVDDDRDTNLAGEPNIRIFWKMPGVLYSGGSFHTQGNYWVKARIGKQNTEEYLKNTVLKDTQKINFYVGSTEYTTTSLVGVFVGPHFSSFKKYTLLGDKSLPTAMIENNTITNIPDVESKFYTAGAGPSGVQWVPYTRPLGIGFLCGPDGLELEPLHNSLLLTNYLNGYNYLQNPNVHIINSATRLFFTDRFIFATETESVEVFSELPFFTSSYTEYLRGARVNLETSYGLKQLNALTGIVGSLIGMPGNLFTPTSTYITNKIINNSAKVISTDRDTVKWGSRYRLGETVNNTINKNWTPALKGAAGTSAVASSRSSNINWGYDDTQRARLNTINNIGANTRSITTTGTRTGNVNLAGIYGGFANSAIGAGLQFATNFLERKAFFTDLRNSTVIQNTTNSSSFLSYVCLLAQSRAGSGTTSDGNWLVDVAFLDGIELDVNQSWYNLYGYETNTYESSSKIREIGSSNTSEQIFTLRLPDTLKPSFTFKYSATLSPLIRELIWTLLNQGVIIVSKQKLQEIGGTNELFNS